MEIIVLKATFVFDSSATSFCAHHIFLAANEIKRHAESTSMDIRFEISMFVKSALLLSIDGVVAQGKMKHTRPVTQLIQN